MNACTSFQRRFTVGRFKVTLTVATVTGQPVGIEFEWRPDLPHRLSKKHQAEYIAKRDAAMASLATEMDCNIVVASPGLESNVKLIKPGCPT